jgi:hypothetical protein
MAGIMVTTDEFAPYNPHSSPSVERSALPTTAPATSGVLWLNGGVLSLS